MWTEEALGMEKVYSDANSQTDLKAITEIREAIRHLNVTERLRVLKYCLEIEEDAWFRANSKT
jgi:hypothetical protein